MRRRPRRLPRALRGRSQGGNRWKRELLWSAVGLAWTLPAQADDWQLEGHLGPTFASSGSTGVAGSVGLAYSLNEHWSLVAAGRLSWLRLRGEQSESHWEAAPEANAGLRWTWDVLRWVPLAEVGVIACHCAPALEHSNLNTGVGVAASAGLEYVWSHATRVNATVRHAWVWPLTTLEPEPPATLPLARSLQLLLGVAHRWP